MKLDKGMIRVMEIQNFRPTNTEKSLNNRQNCNVVYGCVGPNMNINTLAVVIGRFTKRLQKLT